MSWYMLKLKPFWALEVPFFGQDIFFIIGHYIRKYYKLRSVWFTLGDALKKIFLFISSLSMSKQPKKPWGAWLFKLFVYSSSPVCIVGAVQMQFCLPLSFLGSRWKSALNSKQERRCSLWTNSPDGATLQICTFVQVKTIKGEVQQ